MSPVQPVANPPRIRFSPQLLGSRLPPSRLSPMAVQTATINRPATSIYSSLISAFAIPVRIIFLSESFPSIPRGQECLSPCLLQLPITIRREGNRRLLFQATCSHLSPRFLASRSFSSQWAPRSGKPYYLSPSSLAGTSNRTPWHSSETSFRFETRSGVIDV